MRANVSIRPARSHWINGIAQSLNKTNKYKEILWIKILNEFEF